MTGRRLYELFRQTRDSNHGPIGAWHELNPEYQERWNKLADKVRRYYNG